VVKLSQKWGIEVLTVFAFSTENWLRPKVLTHEVCKRFRAAASIS
jgi:undecaprenyl diphosphate synthase